MKEADKSKQTEGAHREEGSGALLLADLPALALELKGEESWQKSRRGSRTVYKSERSRIVLNVLQAGAEIKPHQAPAPISVQVLEGKIRFSTAAEAVLLAKGQLLTLQEHVQHRVEALEASAFLLTLAPLPTKA